MTDFLSTLNEEQIKPVLETEGAVLVIAGAGSGKTRVLTSRIAHIVKDLGVSPYNVLAITFTNKAADEMKDRLAKMIDGSEDMWICTIHSMCVRLLRYGAEKIGFGRDFSIYSESDKEKVIKRIIVSNGLEVDKYYKSAKNIISAYKTKNQTIEEFEAENARMRDLGTFVKIMRAYQEELKRSNAFDFDDLLIKTCELLSTDRETLEKFSTRFRYIHVDEFQDTNAVQYDIVKMLSYVNGNLFVVGDDDQSIYGWRGADVNNILDFEKDFKNANENDEGFRIAFMVIIASIPVAIVGFFLEKYLSDLPLHRIGLNLIITGSILLLTKNTDKIPIKKDVFSTTYYNVLMIGIAQALAVFPGISRSGMTISVALFLGLNRDFAGRFSFLISLPAIFGALILSLKNLKDLKSFDISYAVIGLITSFIFGIIALKFLMSFLRKGKFFHFGFYCMIVGIAVYLYFITVAVN